jgi:uncharacterized protein
VQIRGAVIVVTGAGHGIGRATALALAGQGATVVAVDRDDVAAEAVARLTGGTSITVDLADLSHADLVVAETLSAHGRLDAVIANAGIGYAGAFADMPPETITALIDVNFRAPMLLARAAVPVLIEQGRGGALVFTTSIAGAVPVPTEAAYCASKTALEAFADSLREELREHHIAVSTVRPGVVRTAFHDSRAEPYTRRFPRLIAPERVATAIVEVVTSGAERRTVPPWLELATAARRSVPWLYRSLSRRFGGT